MGGGSHLLIIDSPSFLSRKFPGYHRLMVMSEPTKQPLILEAEGPGTQEISRRTLGYLRLEGGFLLRENPDNLSLSQINERALCMVHKFSSLFSNRCE